MGLPAFRMISAHARGLGAKPSSPAYMQIGVDFRHYLHYFQDEYLSVFLAVALSTDESGWSRESLGQLVASTGLPGRVFDEALTGLCELDIDGHRVLLHNAEYGYLIFPTPEEVETYENGQLATQTAIQVAFPIDEEDEEIGLFTKAHDEKVQQAKILRFERAAAGEPLVAQPKQRRARKVPSTKKAKDIDPLFHVVKAWWTDKDGPGRVIVDHGKDGKSINRVVEMVRGLEWSEADVQTFLQECFLYWTESGPDASWWATKMTLGVLPERIQVWWSEVKAKELRAKQQAQQATSQQRIPVVPIRRKVAS